MAQMIQLPYDNQVVLPIETAQAVQANNENPISLEALGLLVNLLSYPKKWDLRKTELYKRFASNKETAVRNAWKDLMDANYIIEFKYRSGRSYEYVYYFRKVPFNAKEEAKILEQAVKEYGEISTLDFQDPKMRTPKPRGNQKNLINKKTILNNNNNKDIANIDDDKRTKDSAIHNEEQIESVISNFRESTKDELSGRSFNAVVRKVVDKYNQGKVTHFRDYLATALANKIFELEFRRAKDKAKIELESGKQSRIEQHKELLETQPVKKVPFYNWLEDQSQVTGELASAY